MTSPSHPRRRSGRLEDRRVRQQSVARRIALLVAGLILLALLGPWVASYLAG